MEFRLSEKTTLSLMGGYNPFNFKNRVREDGANMNPKLRHWLVMPEFKYWFCRSFERGYLGLHGIYGEYNIAGIPFVKACDYRHGNAAAESAFLTGRGRTVGAGNLPRRGVLAHELQEVRLRRLWRLPGRVRAGLPRSHEGCGVGDIFYQVGSVLLRAGVLNVELSYIAYRH